MKQTRTIILAAVAILLLGGGVALYATSQRGPENGAMDTPETTEETRVIDGVAIPITILNEIEREYPDYIIDDADRETRAGQVYYEINLEHRHPSNDSEYELTYSENWELLDVDFDRD